MYFFGSCFNVRFLLAFWMCVLMCVFYLRFGCAFSTCIFHVRFGNSFRFTNMWQSRWEHSAELNSCQCTDSKRKISAKYFKFTFNFFFSIYLWLDSNSLYQYWGNNNLNSTTILKCLFVKLIFPKIMTEKSRGLIWLVIDDN